MAVSKNTPPKKKVELHPRSKHLLPYDFPALVNVCPELGAFIKANDHRQGAIDFFDPKAVKALNKSLLLHFYDIQSWKIPKHYLCPGVPGRADYIHHLADLLADGKKTPKGKEVRILDLGVGANLVYPIVGTSEYDWSFVGVDIDEKALAAASEIIETNARLQSSVSLRKQSNVRDLFRGIIGPQEKFDAVMCNPPFHASAIEAYGGSKRKIANLKKDKDGAALNFAGKPNELWCEGGERKFVLDMIHQSKFFAEQVGWFTALLSKKDNLHAIQKGMAKAKVKDSKVIQMGTGNKATRIVAWRF